MANSNYIVRLTNNGTAFGASAALDGLAANASMDFHPSNCVLRYNSSGNVDRVYLMNQIVRIKDSGTGAVSNFVGLSGTGANNILRVQIIDKGGEGPVIFDSEAPSSDWIDRFT